MEEYSAFLSSKGPEEMYRKIVNMAKDWARAKAKSVKSFPLLPNGEKGITIKTSYNLHYVLLPDGELKIFKEERGSFIPHENCDHEYLCLETLCRIAKAVKEQNGVLSLLI